MTMRKTCTGLMAAWMACALAAAGCSGHADGGAAASDVHDRGIHIAPEGADATSQLQAVVNVNGVNPATCTYRWSRNGIPLESETRDVLAPSNFHKGDVVTVSVVLPPVAGSASRSLRAQVRIHDAPPVVTSAQLSMNALPSGLEFHGFALCSDPDGDSTTYSCRWYRNGTRIDGATGTDLAVASMGLGDRIEVEVVASDGEAKSEPRRSQQFVLQNRPPQFTSQATAPQAGASVFSYQAVAVDPDGDPVHFELVQAPSGATLSSTGLVQWTMPPVGQRANAGPIVIRATDSKGGEATQTIDLRPQPAPGAPTGA